VQIDRDDERRADAGSAAAGGAAGAVVPVVGVVAALALFGALLWRNAPPPVPEFEKDVHVLPVPLELAAFELVDHRGAAFDRAALEGRWSLLFFGYTYCPDICPITLQSLVPVQERLDAPSDPEGVCVSVDPARDDVARMAEYVGFFHPRLRGVTGEPAQVEALTRAVGAYNAPQEPEPGADGYLVDHATSLFLVGPDARLQAILHEPDDPDAYVSLLRRIQALERSPS
jgi:protein SCO1/2